MAQSKTVARVASRTFIKAFGLAGAATTVLVAPGTTVLLKQIEKHDKTIKNKRKDASRTLAYLKYRKLVEVREKNGQLEYRLTIKGVDRFNKIIIDELNIPTPARWDKKWRLVMFDIPVGFNVERRQFLAKLRALNFYRLQDSCWIHPFECEKQIGALVHHFRFEKYVSYMVVERGNFIDHATNHYKKTGLLL